MPCIVADSLQSHNLTPMNQQKIFEPEALKAIHETMEFWYKIEVMDQKIR